MKALPAEYLPVLPIRNALVFPGISVPLRVHRPMSVAALQKAYENNWPILIVTQKNTEKESDLEPGDFYTVGTLCHIEKYRGTPEEGFQVLVRGASRYKINEFTQVEGAWHAHGRILEDDIDVDETTQTALLQSLKSAATEILNLLPADMGQITALLSGIEDLGFFLNLCSANIDLPVADKQQLLEIPSIKTRALKLLDILQDRRNNLQVQSDVRNRMSQKLDKQQREHLLREQLRAIREELGDESNAKEGEYRDKIEQAGMPEEVKKVALEELKRLEQIGNNSPESHVIRNYLDLLCALPWSRSSDETFDLDEARRVLDHDHYGLDKIKKRILQHLAVMKLISTRAKSAAADDLPSGKEGKRGSILLFVGPPGTGKTSLGQSIAKALGRKFVRVALGGVRDDAEIRGHRRTYIGAMPGRIIQGIKRAGENNPVMMLDEIDKLGFGYQGDPAAALLEVLDPEQNHTFNDHYLDVSFDLSKVFFIATANSLDTIPGPLLDRMEIIELAGYTTAEKLHIAKSHLVPKQLREHGLDEKELQFPDEVLLRLINDYTREAGVRSLQRRIAALCRASTEKVLAQNAELPIIVKPEDLDELLGPPRYQYEEAERAAVPGIVTGLAWTPVGGEILLIESTLMPGNGRLILTGQLGDVMKESAQIALSLVRSRLPSAAEKDHEHERDVHIHVPSGAIPKDGPSAGIAMTVALASIYSGIGVDPKLAMTGEITLRGVVLPVGGIKEKLIAAHRAGIRKVLLPKRNEKDLREVPEEVRNGLEILLVENISDVFKHTLGVEALRLATPPITEPRRPSDGVNHVA